MENASQKSARPRRRRLPRWAWALLILMLLAGGWYLASGRGMRPITVRVIPSNCFLHFSMNGCGYPAMEGPTGKSKGIYNFTARWLDDDGKPLPGPLRVFRAVGVASPDRKVAVLPADKRNIHRITFAWRDGRRKVLDLADGLYSDSLAVTDDGHFTDSRKLYNDRGEALLTAKFLPWITSADPRYVTLGKEGYVTTSGRYRWRILTYTMSLYDIRAKRRLFSTARSTGETGIILHDGKYFLFVPKRGLAQRFAGSTAAGSIGIFPEELLSWWWGEDGSVWTTHNGALQVLDWHHGPLRLRTVGVIPAMHHTIEPLDNRGTAHQYRSSAESLKPSYPAGEVSIGAAIWDDGRLVAIAESRSVWPHQVATTFKSTIRKYPRLQRERRVLTLYRDGRPIGRYAVPIDPNANLLKITPTGGIVLRSSARGFRPGMYTLTVRRQVVAREHLAFTKEGTRLAWVVETKKGKTMRVFKVPK